MFGKHELIYPSIRGIFNIVIACVLLAGCNLKIVTSGTYISKQEAIDAALEIASTSRPELSGAQVTPTQITAQQMTLDKAVKQINPEHEVAVGYNPDMIVWFVKMEGIWLDEFPRPVDFPTPAPYHHYAVILDAKTGLGIEVSASP